MLDFPPSATIITDVLFNQSPIGIVYESLDGGIERANPAFCDLIGYSETQLRHLDSRAISHPDDFAVELRAIQQLHRHPHLPQVFKKRFLRRDGSIVKTEVSLSWVGLQKNLALETTLDLPSDSALSFEDSYLLIFVTDLSQAALIEEKLQQRQQREDLLNTIAALVRRTFDLPIIFQTTTELLKQAIAVDRVIVYQFQSDGSGICVAETVEPAYPSLLGRKFNSDCVPTAYFNAYNRGRFWIVDDVSVQELTACHQQMLNQIHVRGLIVAPIHNGRSSVPTNPLQTGTLTVANPNPKTLWGLLIVHQCRTPRPWTTDEHLLVQAVANQLGIATDQASLWQQLQSYTRELEHRVQERTRSLTQSLKFEQFIHHLTQTLYSELDEDSLLKAAVQGLVETLALKCCRAGLYNAQDHYFEVRAQCIINATATDTALLGQQIPMTQFPEHILECLFQGQVFIGSWSWNLPATHLPIPSLVCPIWDEEGLIGALCLLTPENRDFSPEEIKLIEQVAVQCAIAIRQARLIIREHAFRTSAEYFRRFLENSIDIFVEYDRHLRYCYINPAGATVIGKPAAEIIGKTNQEILGKNAEVIEQSIIQARETQEQVFVDLEIPFPNVIKTYETIYAPIIDHTGTVERIIGIGRDISESRQQWGSLQEQNRQLTAVNRLKEEFIANTSHELRTPLTAVLGFSSVLLSECFGQVNAKQRDYLERINSSGQHLLELINDILDLSRIEANRLELDPDLVFIGDICQSAISLIQERAQSQGTSIELTIEPQLEYMITDPKRLRQMLLNLLTNAVKFTPRGKVGLTVFTTSDLSPLAETAKTIHFLVWDTGIGIDQSDQKRLFFPFSQLDNSLSRKHQGTGLGLAITRKLAELQGGSVTLESHPGQGSQFTLHLPFITPEDENLDSF